MDYILIAIGAIFVASALLLQRRMTPLTLFKLGTSIAAEFKEDNPPRRDPEYYFLTSTIIFRVRFPNSISFILMCSHDA